MNKLTEENDMKTTSPSSTRTDTFRWVRNLFNPVVKPLETAAPPAEVASEPASNRDRRHQTILVVDDDPLFLKLTSSRLNSNGYDVLTAADGTEAIQAARRKKPNLVVLDVNLPQDVTGVPWDGMRLVSWMKRFEELRNIPVVMVTAGDPSKYTRLALNAGATAFFHKRMDPNHLLTMVSHTLSRKCRKTQPEAVASFEI